MKTNNDNCIRVFIPPLVVFLEGLESQKGRPLIKEEVEEICKNAPFIKMEANDAREIEESRGFRDIAPENCWQEWQLARQENELG